MNTDDAIQVTALQKSFKKLSLKRDYTTLKSLILNPLSLGVRNQERLEVLKGITFKVAPGSSLGIIGRNGSGKSTLLKLLAGIYKPNAGTIVTKGRIASLIELGAGFHPEFSGRENIFIYGTVMGLSKREIEERMDEMVRFAELSAFIDAPVRTYSSGMYVRLGFSVAVHVDPDILLIDEVLAVGDESFNHKCLDKMQSFKRAGKTILLVTHDLQAVERFCQDCLWLENGAIQAEGPPNQVIDLYRQYVFKMEEGRGQESPQAPCDLALQKRWGSREIEILKIELADESGKERSVYDPESALSIKIHYQMNQDLKDVVFGIGIFNGEGVCCYGTNTEIDRTTFPDLPPRGTITCLLDKLSLVEGTYFLDAAVHARDGRAYDYQARYHSFSVRSTIKDTGIFRPQHRWALTPSLED